MNPMNPINPMNPMNTDNELKLISEELKLVSDCISGVATAQDVFIKKYSHLVYRFVKLTFILYNIPYTFEDIQELHNSVFLQLFDKDFKRLKQFEGKNGCSLASWVRLITTRTVLNYIRQHNVDAAWQNPRIPLEEVEEVAISYELGAHDLIEDTQLKQLIQIYLNDMAPRDRLFVKLYFEQEVPIPKIASIMRMSIPNAHTVKHRVVERLKELLKEKHADIIEENSYEQNETSTKNTNNIKNKNNKNNKSSAKNLDGNKSNNRKKGR